MSNVTLSQLTKSFGELTVIPSMDLEVHDGEFVVLVGPSGCGKTTALRMIAGLESSSGGTIKINNTDVTTARPGLRNCAMVFQNYALYPHMTVADNICYGLKIRGASKQERQEALDKVSGILGLSALVDRKPRDLSGGQRQRVAIGRALVREPDVFLFDEPLSNLDAKLRVEMRAEIKKLHQRLQATIVYVTHDQVEAMTLADRVVVMRSGIIEQAASPLELYESPANIFVASFIGAPSMNFLEADVNQQSNQLMVTIQGVDYPVLSERLNKKLSGRVGSSLTVGIRPEHITDVANDHKGLLLHVDAIETLGSHKMLLGQVGDNRFSAQVDAHSSAAINDKAALIIDVEKMYFFDTSTEQAI